MNQANLGNASPTPSRSIGTTMSDPKEKLRKTVEYIVQKQKWIEQQRRDFLMDEPTFQNNMAEVTHMKSLARKQYETLMRQQISTNSNEIDIPRESPHPSMSSNIPPVNYNMTQHHFNNNNNNINNNNNRMENFVENIPQRNPLSSASMSSISHPGNNPLNHASTSAHSFHSHPPAKMVANLNPSRPKGNIKRKSSGMDPSTFPPRYFSSPSSVSSSSTAAAAAALPPPPLSSSSSMANSVQNVNYGQPMRKDMELGPQSSQSGFLALLERDDAFFIEAEKLQKNATKKDSRGLLSESPSNPEIRTTIDLNYLQVLEEQKKKEKEYMEKLSFQTKREESITKKIKMKNEKEHQERLHRINWLRLYQPFGLYNRWRKIYNPAFTPENMLIASMAKEVLVPIRIDVESDNFKLRDTFTWNLNESLITPEQFAKALCEDFRVPVNILAPLIAKSICEQLSEYFPPVDVNDNDGSRFLIRLDINVGNVALIDQFEWDIHGKEHDPEFFAELLCSELGLGGEFITAIAHSIREQVVLYSKSLAFSGFIGDLVDVTVPSLSIDSMIRNNDLSDVFTPVLTELTDQEIEKMEQARDREARRKRRQGRGARSELSIGERLTTRRTPLPNRSFPLQATVFPKLASDDRDTAPTAGNRRRRKNAEKEELHKDMEHSNSIESFHS